MHTNPDPWDTILAGSRQTKTAVTVLGYSRMLKSRDRAGIAELIRLRFSERYLDPVDPKLDNPNTHGFAMLAIYCLMVEALESFRNGWKGTQGIKGGSEAAFRSFFQVHDEFKDLSPVAAKFFKHIRCGILHQAETTGNWTVNRSSVLFSKSDNRHQLSASEFGKRLRVVLTNYTTDISNTDWRDQAWRNVRKKFKAICRECGLSDDDVKKLQ
jgi:hypothetical protein